MLPLPHAPTSRVAGPAIVGSAAPFDPALFPARDWSTLIMKTRLMELHRASKARAETATPDGTADTPPRLSARDQVAARLCVRACCDPTRR